MRLVLIGPPGAGKGTQASRLSERLDIPTIPFSDVFADHKDRGTELGKKAAECIDRGELVPDDVTVEMARERLSESDVADGFLLDGFPRTVPQAEALDEFLAEHDAALDGAIYLKVPTEVVVGRLAKRSEHEDRSDDDEETVRNRLRVFEESTAPLLEHYRERGLLLEVEGDGTEDEVLNRTLEAVHSHR